VLRILRLIPYFLVWSLQTFGAPRLGLGLEAAAELMRQSTFPRSGVLVVGANYIQSLLPSTLRSQAESLLESHRIEDAIGLADQQRKKLESNLTVDSDEVCSITV
jgi:hypothetical protein